MGISVKITLNDSELRRLIAASAGGAIKRIVADGVTYGLYQEMGVENGFGRGIKIPAHPFMRPAVEAVRGGFVKAFQGCVTWALMEAVVVKTAFDVERLAKDKAPFETGALMSSIHVE